jgi:hypothetical protein
MTIGLNGYKPTNTASTTLLYALNEFNDLNPYWTDDTVVAVMQMTDGYHITVGIDLVIAGDQDPTSTNGMCFGHEPATNGGYCLTWVGTGDTLPTQIK